MQTLMIASTMMATRVQVVFGAENLMTTLTMNVEIGVKKVLNK